MSLAARTLSRTHFEVLGLGFGLEASSPRKLPCPRLEDSTIFCTVELLLENARNLAEILRRPFLFSAIGDRLKNLFDIIINQICSGAQGLREGGRGDNDPGAHGF